MTMHRPGDLPRICFVAPYAFPALSGDENSRVIGGAEIQQSIVARGLVKRGYNVSMICLDFGQEAVVNMHGIRVIRAFRADAGIPVLRYVWPRTTSLWSSMKRADADIYYQRTANRNTGLVAGFCKHHGKKSIFAASANQNFERNTRRIRYRRDRWQYEYGVRNVDRILAQNAEQVQLCLTNFGRTSTLVPNCYERPVHSRNAISREILWVGAIRQLKRPDLFLELAAALPQYRFTMIGGPEVESERMFTTIKTEAARFKNVRFMGFVPYTKIDRHFDDAALLVNTSESEGFPNSFLQAWSRGTVTISFVDCGARRDGVPIGIIVPTLEHMTRVISELMTDDARRREEGMSCKQYFERNHAPDRVLDIYEKIFSELVVR